MGVLILGDVHGCYHTLKALIRERWRPEEDNLVLVGDLINKGPHSVKAFKYWLKLKTLHPQKVILIRGNHEQWFLENYRHNARTRSFQALCTAFQNAGLNPRDVAREISRLPLHWESEHLFVSHAGLSEAALDPFDPSDLNGLLKNRKTLKRLSKVQVIGHNIISAGKPLFKPNENAWYVDTGAWCNQFLSALHFNLGSSIPKVYQMARKPKDELPISVK
ncbi:metallophosphoesterase family protein [Croceimicrobium sp.]|uniref:metallophosphoesterase family protein n=1 Tax=Croceimicrobium sp. TaxID=2828340 RepID=UPI003BAA1161